MIRREAEIRIRRHALDWLAEQGAAGTSTDAPSFSSFHAWLTARDPAALDFRSIAGPRYDAEAWYDDVTGQNWRR
ncbi:hypothetical protein HB662_01530 [Roseomonas frigidaquae]|uniref:Uncharacterized protein n=1 Tax=Falsiroseomonas frigidaquae TaxID=487318 RepID=A0ABX1ESE5_9PROT|nr:hypothetical protein [Falsiroseomonas frigidaquae]NKE43440.1 hypothetical protein [Falsiroseomonas frigidaquae]